MPSLRESGVLEPLACPICRGPLDEQPGWTACAPCGLRYRVEDGLYTLGPAFAAMTLAEPSFEHDRMVHLLEDCALIGWPQAERRLASEVLAGTLTTQATSRLARIRAKLAGATWEDVLQDVVNPTRAGWKFLLDFDQDSRVLVLGPSWGAVPLTLAQGVAEVVVLDGDTERLKVIRAQAESQGLTNVTVARVFDPVRLPLGDGTIDVAVIPCLGSWFATVAGGRPLPTGAALTPELLAEIRRTLAPSGQLYLGMDSRLGATRVLAPRKEVGAGVSPRMLRRMAERSGFADCHLFAPLPFRHKFHQILDLDRSDRMNFCADPYRTRGRVLRSLVKGWEITGRPNVLERRVYPFLPGMAAVLSASADPTSFAERLLGALADAGTIPAGARSLSRYFVRPRGVVVLAGGAPGEGGTPGEEAAFVRLPLDARAETTCVRHHDTIVALADDRRIAPALRALFPQPLGAGSCAGQAYFAETARPGEVGRVYYSRSTRRYNRAIQSAAEVVCALRRATEVPVLIDQAEFDRLCGDWLGDLRGIVRADVLPALTAIDEWLRDTMLGATLPLGWHHGDYDFANLLYGPDDTVTGILDFEAFEPRGLPLIDLLLLLARRLIRTDGLAFGDVFVRAILTGELAAIDAKLFERECAIVGVDERMRRAIAVCSWLNHLKLRRDSWLVRSPTWLDANLHSVLDTVRSSL